MYCVSTAGGGAVSVRILHSLLCRKLQRCVTLLSSLSEEGGAKQEMLIYIIALFKKI